MFYMNDDNIDYGTTLFSTFKDYKFGDSEISEKPTDDKEYVPIFGVGGIDETRTWSTHSRPIKFTPPVYKTYGITPGSSYESIVNKEVGVVRRIVKDGIKSDEYHCPRYTILEISYPHMWSICTAKIKCEKTGEIEDHINIGRIVIPNIIEINPKEEE